MSDQLVLADTSLWIEAFRGREPAARYLRELLLSDLVATCDVVIAELLAGPLSAPEFARVRRQLDAVRYLEAPAGLGWQAGELALTLRERGLRVPATDLLVAAIALAHSAALAHCDKHFEAIGSVADLKTVPLFSPGENSRGS